MVFAHVTGWKPLSLGSISRHQSRTVALHQPMDTAWPAVDARGCGASRPHRHVDSPAVCISPSRYSDARLRGLGSPSPSPSRFGTLLGTSVSAPARDHATEETAPGLARRDPHHPRGRHGRHRARRFEHLDRPVARACSIGDSYRYETLPAPGQSHGPPLPIPFAKQAADLFHECRRTREAFNPMRLNAMFQNCREVDA